MATKTIKPEGPVAWARQPGIWKYGGTLDKEPAATEIEQTYAYQHFVEISTARGSAYTTSVNSLVGYENLALARAFSALSRAAERLACNALPITSHEALRSWIDRLGIPVNELDNWDAIRLACAAQYRLALGPTATNEDDAIASMLGPALVKIWRQIGTDLANPPPITYWPGINPGPPTLTANYAISKDETGAKRIWLSEREHLVVEVQQPPTMSVSDFLRLMNARLFKLLDDMLPSTATFDWAMGPLTTGFLLDVSQLDFTGLTP